MEDQITTQTTPTPHKFESLQSVSSLQTRQFNLPTEKGSYLANITDRLILEVEVGYCRFDDEDYDYAIFSSQYIDPSLVSGQFQFAKEEYVHECGKVALYWEYENRPDNQFELIFEAIEKMCAAPAPKDDYSDLYGDSSELTEEQKNCPHSTTHTECCVSGDDDLTWKTRSLICDDCGLVLEECYFEIQGRNHEIL
jgi:hypothetical protein